MKCNGVKHVSTQFEGKDRTFVCFFTFTLKCFQNIFRKEMRVTQNPKRQVTTDLYTGTRITRFQAQFIVLMLNNCSQVAAAASPQTAPL